VYEEQKLEAGSIVLVDETADLRFQLEDKAESEHAFDVWIRCLGKIDIEDNQTMWRFKVGVKDVGLKTDMDDIPF